MPTWDLEADVAAGWQNLAALTGSAAFQQVLTEGFIQALDGPVFFRFRRQPPRASDRGTRLVADAGKGLGPVNDPSTGWPLRYMWVRRAEAATPAVIVGQGVVE